MYVKYINTNMYAKYGDNANNEYLEKNDFLRLFSAVRRFCLEISGK